MSCNDYKKLVTSSVTSNSVDFALWKTSKSLSDINTCSFKCIWIKWWFTQQHSQDFTLEGAEWSVHVQIHQQTQACADRRGFGRGICPPPPQHEALELVIMVCYQILWVRCRLLKDVFLLDSSGTYFFTFPLSLSCTCMPMNVRFYLLAQLIKE